VPGDELVRAQGQIALLLEEYRSLRSEATGRVSDRMSLLGFLTASGAFVIGSHRALWAYVIAGCLLAVGGAVWYSSWRSLDKISGRLALLEAMINAQARVAFELGSDCQLLGWETRLQKERAKRQEHPRRRIRWSLR
jgi:hypothetical protein